MPRYRVFGRTLISDLAFPELREAGSVVGPIWRLRRAPVPEADGREPAEAGDLLGEAWVEDGISVRLVRTAGGFRLAYADTGTFAFSAGEVTWHPNPGADPAAVRADVLGRVLPAALHLGGHLCLHASAVAWQGGAMAFLAPKRYGKSTLAASLVDRGAGLLTDDALAVTAPPEPLALPGVPSVRLWEDSARRIRVESRRRRGLGGKFLLAGLPEERLPDRALPLRALYLLVPERADAEAVERASLASLPASMALLGNVKNADLLGGTERARLLRRASALVEAVPVYALRIPRDLGRLPEVADRILGWHACSPASRRRRAS